MIPLLAVAAIVVVLVAYLDRQGSVRAPRTKDEDSRTAIPQDAPAPADSRDDLAYPGVTMPDAAPSITGDEEVDRYIRDKAHARGYRLRPLADEGRLVSYRWQRVQPEMKAALEEMFAEAEEADVPLVFASGYRSVDRQREIFLGKLGSVDRQSILAGARDSDIDSILAASSIPGYSKHHTGFAADFGCGSFELEDAFRETACYEWLSRDGFAGARRFGFVPSYPDDAPLEGPDPEPWEFVWVPEAAR